MIEPNPALIKFHQKYCNTEPIDSLIVFEKLVEKLNRITNTKRSCNASYKKNNNISKNNTTQNQLTLGGFFK